MLPKQFGALHFFVLAALLAFSVIVGLGVLFFLDRAMLARTAAQSQYSGINGAAAPQRNNAGGTKIFEVSPANSSNTVSGTINKNLLNDIGKNPERAKEVLRNAPAGTIQNAVQTKTGKVVSTDKIERARQKALSSDGQQKINEALKRRDEIDFSKIREKLEQ